MVLINHIFYLGKYPCLWCLITSAGMQLARNDSQRGTIEKRTLATLKMTTGNLLKMVPLPVDRSSSTM